MALQVYEMAVGGLLVVDKSMFAKAACTGCLTTAEAKDRTLRETYLAIGAKTMIQL